MIARSDAPQIYRDRDFYVPQFQVSIDGRNADPTVVGDILQVTYKDSVDAIDSFQLTINNWDADRQKLKYTEEDLFDPGRQVELRMGYRDQIGMSLMIRGKIRSLRMTYPASGAPTLSVTGLNILADLHRKQRTARYEQMTASQIAQRIGTQAGIAVRTNPDPISESAPHEYLLQDDKTDLVFLMKLAKDLEYELVVDEEGDNAGLYFGPPRNVRQVAYQLRYGATLNQFHTTLDTASQKGSVTIKASHPSNKEKIEATKSRADLELPGLNNAGRQRGLDNFLSDFEEVSAMTVQNQEKADEEAASQLKRIAVNLIRGSGTTVGLPELRAGRFVFIEGIGDHFAGHYFVTSTTHTLGNGGYTTQFECRREEPGGKSPLSGISLL
jgi:phage protein D